MLSVEGFSSGSSGTLSVVPPTATNPVSAAAKNPDGEEIDLAKGVVKDGASNTKVIGKAAAKSYFTVDNLLNVKWSKVLPPGSNVVYTSLIVKRNVMGIAIKRQLILTDQPSLLYVDTSNMTVKGAVEWTKTSPPRAVFVSISICFFEGNCILNTLGFISG